MREMHALEGVLPGGDVPWVSGFEGLLYSNSPLGQANLVMALEGDPANYYSGEKVSLLVDSGSGLHACPTWQGGRCAVGFGKADRSLREEGREVRGARRLHRDDLLRGDECVETGFVCRKT